VRSIAVLTLSLLAFPAPCLAKPRLDRKLERKIEDLGERWWKARPKNKFFEWDAAQRKALLAEARALGPIPEGTFEDVKDALWDSVRRYGPKGEGRGKVHLDNPYEKPYRDKMWFYVSGRRRRDQGLIVGLHGGGAGAGSADGPKGTWRMKRCLGMYPQGLVITGDNWNTVQGEKQILSMIEIAKAQYDIDPDRVYVAGFSMGGTGAWHMAGRFPDLFAGAAPCAGVLMAQPKSQLRKKEEVLAIQYGLVPNVRNLAMYYFIGLKDTNTMPGTYLFVQDMLKELRESDPGGYDEIHFEVYPDLAHAFPPGEPQKCLETLGKERRVTYPEKIVWEYARYPFPRPVPEDRTKRIVIRHMYWLRHDKPEDRMEIVATRKGNEFDVSILGAGREGAYVLLNPEMIDVEKDVVVRVEGEEVYRGRPRPDVATVLETLDVKLDKRLCFDRKIPLWDAGASAPR